MIMMIYLGGAIDLAKKDFRVEFTPALKRRGMNAFNPKGAFNLGDMTSRKDMEKLVEVNKYAMMACDVSLFVMDEDTPSTGTPMELLMAHQEDRAYVVLWSGKGIIPAYVSAFTGGKDHQILLVNNWDYDSIIDYLGQARDAKLRPKALFGSTVVLNSGPDTPTSAMNKGL